MDSGRGKGKSGVETQSGSASGNESCCFLGWRATTVGFLCSVFSRGLITRLIIASCTSQLWKGWIIFIYLNMAIRELSPEDIISGGTKLARAGLEGGKLVIAYGKPALENSGNLSVQVRQHLPMYHGFPYCLSLKYTRQLHGGLKTLFWPLAR